MERKTRVVFVHGWSVTSHEVYGGLPQHLAAVDERLDIQHVYLGQYISFRDEVRVSDIALAMEAAVRRELKPLLEEGERFICITHSTGAPVVREWWQRQYVDQGESQACPMSHLIMLAPANFGSALARLGKSTVGRIKAWKNGIQRGTGVLEWLELGSDSSIALNRAWLEHGEQAIETGTLFPFVLSGQGIDRMFYDQVNYYTGESGSDGVVRLASANCNATWVTLKQARDDTDRTTGELRVEESARCVRTAFRVIRGAAHSGEDMGIMASVPADPTGSAPEVVECIRRCIGVETPGQYQRLCEAFDEESLEVQREERIEREDRVFLSTRYFIHDRYAQVIFRLFDHHGHAVDDFDVLFTAGVQADALSPNYLPEGFAVDRQRNSKLPNALTYYLNHDLLVRGSDEVADPKRKGKILRAAVEPPALLGLTIRARPDSGFVHYVEASLNADSTALSEALRANETTVVDIQLSRGIHEGLFRLRPADAIDDPSFKDEPPGDELPGI